MSAKKTILHVINTLEKGGAEKMLVTVSKELSEYNNIIVTLWDKNAFKDELNCDQYICLHAGRPLLSVFTAFKLRKLIKQYKPDIIHSHLFWSTFVARIATSKAIPLINTIHTFSASSVDYKRGYVRLLDRLSYRFSNPVIVAVAKGALEEYFDMIKQAPRNAHVLYTFVDVKIFKQKETALPEINECTRLISIGTLKAQKNQQYLIEAFKQLKQENIQLDIYGEGPLRPVLENSLLENAITTIALKGTVNNIQEVISKYDLFVMPSAYEGFSLAVLEAMALNMPMLLSDIASFREQCAGTAVYFSLDDPHDFVIKLKHILADKQRLRELGNSAGQRVLANFTLEHHMQGLRNIYKEALQKD